MSFINEIYLSKLSRVQSRLDCISNRTGINTKSFDLFLSKASQSHTAASAQPSELEVQPFANKAEARVGATAYSGAAAVQPKSVNAQESANYEDIINQAAMQHGLEASLIKAVIMAESGFNPNAVSKSGAKGLMQLMPATAQSLGVGDSFNPYENIMGGSRYLSRQLQRFGDVRLALAAYLCGPGRVEGLGIQNADNAQQYAKLPSGAQKYISNVMSYYKTFKTLLS